MIRRLHTLTLGSWAVHSPTAALQAACLLWSYCGINMPLLHHHSMPCLFPFLRGLSDHPQGSPSDILPLHRSSNWGLHWRSTSPHHFHAPGGHSACCYCIFPLFSVGILFMEVNADLNKSMGLFNRPESEQPPTQCLLHTDPKYSRQCWKRWCDCAVTAFSPSSWVIFFKCEFPKERGYISPNLEPSTRSHMINVQRSF